MTTEMTRQNISDRTGFDTGEEWETPEEVRAYFTRATLAECVPGYPEEELPTDLELSRMADLVIANKWHCTF